MAGTDSKKNTKVYLIEPLKLNGQSQDNSPVQQILELTPNGVDRITFIG